MLRSLFSSATGPEADRIALILEADSLTRASLVVRAENVISRLEGRALAKCLIYSSSVVDVITALLVCERLGITLYIAHSYLAPDLVETVIREQRIELVFEGEMRLRWLEPDCSAPIEFTICLMTSGTTGLPKIAQHRPESLTGRIRYHRSQLERSRWLLTYPPSSFAGLQVILTALLSDGALVCPSDYSIATLVAFAQSRAVTHASGTPTFWRGVLVALGAGEGLPELSQITIGGETVDQGTLDRLRGKFPQARITHIYASTEAGSVFAVNDGMAGFPSEWLHEPVDGVELRVEDDILWVRAPRAMVGYLSGHRSSAGDQGWLCTGDRMRVEGGRVYFAGRSDQTINVGGSKVFPEDVEAVIRRVTGVLDSRVSGFTSPISGNVLMAEVVVTPGAETDGIRRELIALCRAQLSLFQVPRVIRFVPEIERAASGKKLTVLGKETTL